jgi:hypothetical protein
MIPPVEMRAKFTPKTSGNADQDATFQIIFKWNKLQVLPKNLEV